MLKRIAKYILQSSPLLTRVFYHWERSRMYNEVAYWARWIMAKDLYFLDSTKRLAAEWKDILEQSTPLLKSASTGKRVLLVTGNGLNAVFLSVETLLFMALRLRGQQCLSLICDKGLPSCEFSRAGAGHLPMEGYGNGFTPAANASVCNACSTAARLALGSIGAEVCTLPEFGQADDYAKAQELIARVQYKDIRDYVYKGIAVGDHAFSSTLRVTLRGTIDLHNPEELWIYRRQFLSTIVMVDRFSRCLDILQPDKVVGVHGVYLTHGIMVDVCSNRGVDVVVYGMPYRKGTLWFSHKETYHRSLINEPYTSWENLELSEEMNHRLDEYLASKTAGGRDNVNYHPNPITDKSQIITQLKLKPKLPVISMFTNVIWDAQIYYQYNAFENMFDWLFSTIEYFKSRPKLQLVIRIHPAESKGGFTTKQPLYPEIMRRFPVLPYNVFVIPSESNLSSYTLAEMSHAALIYGTKMGLEIAIRGIPVIVGGETFNRGKGFTYDVENPEQYFRLLDKILELPRNNDMLIQRARRFAYYLFFMRMIDVPILNTDLHKRIRVKSERFFTFNNLDSLIPGKCSNLDVICDGIVNGTPFFSKQGAACGE